MSFIADKIEAGLLYSRLADLGIFEGEQEHKVEKAFTSPRGKSVDFEFTVKSTADKTITVKHEGPCAQSLDPFAVIEAGDLKLSTAYTFEMVKAVLTEVSEILIAKLITERKKG